MGGVAWPQLFQPKKQGGLGFRDLCAFNLALLAKQRWRLLTNPDSLLARVLEAKYYPHGNFLEANLDIDRRQHGRVSSKPGTFCSRGLESELATGIRRPYGIRHGFQKMDILRCSTSGSRRPSSLCRW